MGINTHHLRWGGVADLEPAITRRQAKREKVMLWGEGGDPVGYALGYTLTDWSLSLGSWGRSDQKWDILGTDLGELGFGEHS